MLARFDCSPEPAMNGFSIRRVLAALPLALFATLAPAQPAPGSPAAAAAPAVDVAAVTLTAITPQIRASGTVVSTRDAAISAEVPGRLVIVAEVGDRVKQGDAVAVIDDRVWRLQRESDEATIRRLQANLAYMERQQARLSLLVRQNNTAQAELDELRAKREMIAQDVESAKVQLARTEYDLSRAKVLAPFDGVIAERYQGAGEYTKQGEDVVRLVNTASLEVAARAPIAATRYNREGAQVQVTGDFGAASLPIRSLVKVGDPQSRLVEVRLPVGGLDWIIGEPVEVVLAGGARKEVLAVPRDALVQRKSGAYVFRVDDAGVAHKVPVIPGDDDGRLVAVTGELQPRDRVVVLGSEKLRDGQTVSVRPGSVAVR
jgi:RND family efflux transporter MFP subunit